MKVKLPVAPIDISIGWEWDEPPRFGPVKDQLVSGYIETWKLCPDRSGGFTSTLQEEVSSWNNNLKGSASPKSKYGYPSMYPYGGNGVWGFASGRSE